MSKGKTAANSSLITHHSSLLPGFVLPQQLAEPRIVADRFQIAVLAHVAKIAIAKLDRPPECLQGLIGLFEQCVRAGEVIVGQGVVGRRWISFLSTSKPSA